MIKYFCIYSKQKVYVGTIVPKPPVKGVRKISSNIPGTSKLIWQKFSQINQCKNVDTVCQKISGIYGL